jgi:FixJ family two-component response regulator
MTDTETLVFVVDDDVALRASLQNLLEILESVGLRVAAYASAQDSCAARARRGRAAWCSMCGCRA